jgi:ABC-type uncharacterized transport system permease subunit
MNALYWSTAAAFYGGLAAYLGGTGAALGYLSAGRAAALRYVVRLSMAGALLVAATLILRSVSLGRLPFPSSGDALNLFVLLTTCIVLLVSRRTGNWALLCLVVPPLAAVYILNAVVARDFLGYVPRDIVDPLLPLHVGLAFFAYGLFLVASLTSVAYLLKAHSLKRRRLSNIFHRLPALEQLDQTLYRLTGGGYVAFLGTLVAGVLWALRDRELLGPQWWLSPKVLHSLLMAVFYGICFHGRQLGLLRGQKLAWTLAVGFGAFLAVYLVLSVLDLNTWLFWESPR